MEIILIVSWYGAGFAVARHLVHRGHSAVPWVLSAALLGASVAVVAVPAVLLRGRGGVEPVVVQRSEAPPDDGTHVFVLDRPTRLAGTVADLPTPVAARMGRCSLVAAVGHEAFSRTLATGEREHAVRTLSCDLRPMSDTDDRVVTTMASGAVRRAATLVDGPDAVVTSTPGGRAAARRLVALARDLGVPIVVVPARPRDQVSPLDRDGAERTVVA